MFRIADQTLQEPDHHLRRQGLAVQHEAHRALGGNGRNQVDTLPFGLGKCQHGVSKPWADAAGALHEYGLDLVDTPEAKGYDGVILAVAHEAVRTGGTALARGFGKAEHVLSDLKHVFVNGDSDLRL